MAYNNSSSSYECSGASDEEIQLYYRYDFLRTHFSKSLCINYWWAQQIKLQMYESCFHQFFSPKFVMIWFQQLKAEKKGVICQFFLTAHTVRVYKIV